MHTPTQKAADPARKQALLAVLRNDLPFGTPLLPNSPSAIRPDETSVRYGLAMAIMSALLIAAAFGGLMLGSVRIPSRTAVSILGHAMGGDALVTPDWRDAYETIILKARLPRVLMAASVGACLAVTGMAIQALVRNPLASPSILGVSSGAATGAVIVMRWGLVGLGAFTLNLAAFAGALLTLVVVFWIARSGGQMTPTRLILGGVAMSSMLSAVTSLLVLTSPDPQLASRVLFWTLGGFGTAQWKLLPIPLAALAAGLGLMLLQARRLDLLLAGDEGANALGLDVGKFRKSMFVLAAALTGITVSVSGVIGFVGLIMPHMVRFLVGTNHRRALPAAALLGAGFTVGADLVARSIIAPLELPVGIVTALVGGPFFIWLLMADASARGQAS